MLLKYIKMSYWKDKVLTKVKKIFEKNGAKKAAAAEACKAFDDAKEQYSNEFDEKKTELQPKVVEIYEAAAAEIKTLVKEPKEAGLKKHSAGVQKLLEELVKIEFPGSKAVSEASSKFGPSYVSGPIIFVFEKVSTFVVTEDNKEEDAAETSATTEEVKEKDIVVEAAGDEKKEETTPVAVADAPAPEVVVEKTVATPAAETAKVEEVPAAPASDEPPKA